MQKVIFIGSEKIAVEVSKAVFFVLEEERHKEENLRHESRRHWDARAFDESIIAKESHHHSIYMETPEETYFRKEKFKAVYETLATCTPIQRERFLLYALDGLSFAEIARQQGCSKYAVRDSVEAVRKKNTETFDGLPPRKPTFWLLSEGL